MKPSMSKRLLTSLYVDEQLALATIGRMLGCSHEWIRRCLDYYGIERRARGGRSGSMAPDGRCEECGRAWDQS